ncbi:MAG TPA: hypothetical protein PKX28_09610 [Candidatus Hydrogenedentes bacterium]|nr:hypothetical protein [Candidatus Hydrogenedentota bacterium]HOJ68376.1 hypothetical protein [Candidatus Hydrogenedentota bacterium]HOK89823.1 hypothetical protein [Candidatus Hydrogenedentota bacterium]HPO31488.1 hypothetical protein [Candidatus Hydrogenedentota bacterium]
MNTPGHDATRLNPGIPPDIDLRDPRQFLFLSGFAPLDAASTLPAISRRPAPPSGNSMISSLMEAEVLLHELEEQPREPEE